MKKSILVIVVILIIAFTGWLIFRQSSPSSQLSQSDQSQKAPNFSLQDYNGKTVSLADFKGKRLIINSWASWCPFCRQELPDFTTAQKEVGDKLVIIAIDRGESLNVAKGYTDQQGTTNKLIFLLDPSDSFYQSIGGFSMPETIFVDENGLVRYHKRGPMNQQEIHDRIKQAFNL